MPGMIPREARGPGARREGEAHRASARAGARRARQGGRGAGRVPQVRRDAPRVRGARRGRVAGAVPQVLRPRPLAQGHGPARVPRARGGRLCGLRRARVRGRDARGVRGGPQGVPGHVPARAHGAQRGRGPRPCAVREGTAVSCQVDGTRPGESPAGRRPGSAAGMPREPRRSAAPCASAAYRTPRRAWSAGGRPRRRALRGRGPGPADRRGARPRPWGPWARERPSRPTASGATPGCPPALACRATTRRPRGRPCAASSAWRCATRARPEGFLARFRGVSTRRLGHYLDWFLWDEQTRRSDADRADTLSGQAATGGYDNTRFVLAREPQPLWSYWEDELVVPTVV